MIGPVKGDGTFVPIASFPKSGNTWVRAFLSAWFRGSLANLDELVAPPILSLRQHFDEVTGVSSTDLTLDEIDRLRPAFHRALAREMGSTCFVKLHDSWYRNHIGEPLFDRTSCRGAIHLVRHPAAVAVSYAHHLQVSHVCAVDLMANQTALRDWWPQSIDPNLPQRVGSWSTHAESWQDQDSLPLLTVRYEDLLRDPERKFSEILQFAGFESDDGRIAEAVAASGFDRLRDLERERGFRERAGGHAFFHTGRADGWRGQLQEELLERLACEHGRAMARFGYDLGGAR